MGKQVITRENNAIKQINNKKTITHGNALGQAIKLLCNKTTKIYLRLLRIYMVTIKTDVSSGYTTLHQGQNIKNKSVKNYK